MQPNQQYQQPQQGWGQQAPQYGPPQPQQNYGPPSQPQTPQQGAGAFADPSAGGAPGPLPRHLIDCTVIYVPRSVQSGSNYDNTGTKDNVIADVIVVSSPAGSITYGDSQDRKAPRPNTHRIAVPCFFPGVLVGNGQVVNALRAHVPAFANADPTPVLGALVHGTQAILFNKITDPAERDKAGQIWSAHLAGQMQWPAPEPLAQQPQQGWAPQPVQQYQQPQQGWGPPQQQAPQGWPAPGTPGNAGM